MEQETPWISQRLQDLEFHAIHHYKTMQYTIIKVLVDVYISIKSLTTENKNYAVDVQGKFRE